jgi:hypothetical protein
MAHMTLPAAHSEADARLAERIGRVLELEEVHVFWTLPAPATEGPAPSRPPARRAGLLGMLSALVGRISG